MSNGDDVALIEDLHKRGVTPGNLLSIVVTLLTGIGVVVGGAWTARGVLDQMQAQTEMLSIRLDQHTADLQRQEAARTAGDKALFEALQKMNQRIDNLFDGRTHGQNPSPNPSDFGDVTKPVPG